ncbi:MAG: arylsulfatase [Planctomycetota bacterium]|nr:arylsulfatase [Planctomycetota bacterium]MDA1143202.1 arylsulfatase [Planctomycetota bacterium]
MADRPNIILILNDDMGFSDLGCYGGEIETPSLNELADNGIRFTQFYNTARCCPTRASLLTGLYQHQAAVGHMMNDYDHDGYRGDLSPKSVTIAQVLKASGYSTYMSGKWHVTRHITGPQHNWPIQRGFDRFHGTIQGACSYFQPTTLTIDNKSVEPPDEDDYYYTDAISDWACKFIKEHKEERSEIPFFTYVAYTAPHWPLHAPKEDVARYKGRFDCGWDKLRDERLERLIEMGIIHPDWKLTPRDESQVPWEQAENKEWQARRMEVYAAQVDRMDQGIGRIIQTLKDTGQLGNTLIMFLADNGGCAEEIGGQWGKSMPKSNIATARTRDGGEVAFGNDPSRMPGGEDTYQSYGVPWANVSNTPFRLYKHWVHEGGIATPLIVHWPDKIPGLGELRDQPGQLPDIMATFLEVAGAEYPAEYEGNELFPLEGKSLTPIFDDEPNEREVLYWEHEGNRAVRKGNWKLVNKHPGDWELYDIAADRTELNDLAADHPDVVKALVPLYEEWAERCGVIPWTELMEEQRMKREGEK